MDPLENTNKTASQQPEEKTSMREYIIELFKFFLLALIIVVPIRIFIAQPYLVSGASMEPNFKNGDYLIIDQLTYRFENPERGDVIVLRYPQKPSLFFIKRIIGLPGETIEAQNGKVTVYTPENQLGSILEEKYLPEAFTDSFAKKELSEKEYFVMGDNRRESLDSRIWGTLTEDFIIGKPLVRLFPPLRISFQPGTF